MNLMTPKTVRRFTLATTHADVPVDILSYATGECALGKGRPQRQWRLRHSDRRRPRRAGGGARRRFPQATLVANEAVVHDDLCKVIRFVDKPTKGLDLTLDMRGTALQRRVWEKLRAIPVGRTYTPDSGQSLSVVGISAQCHKRPPCIVAKSDA